MNNKEAIDYINLIFARDRANELHFISHDEEIALDLAIKALEDARPTGKWNFNDGVWGCSMCWQMPWYFDRTPMKSGYKFCPYCGARMEAENE